MLTFNIFHKTIFIVSIRDFLLYNTQNSSSKSGPIIYTRYLCLITTPIFLLTKHCTYVATVLDLTLPIYVYSFVLINIFFYEIIYFLNLEY